jgi:heat shock protein HslJ
LELPWQSIVNTINLHYSIRKDTFMKKITLTILVLLVATGMILSACASTVTTADPSGASWRLVSYGEAGKQTLAAAGIETSLVFGKDGKVNGNMGCNSFSGNYKLKGTNIIFSQTISTLMACPEPQMTQEGTAFQVMNGTARLQIDNNTLTIYAASGGNAITLSR